MSKAIDIVFNILANASGVTTLLGQQNITPLRSKEGTTEPYITFRRVSEQPWMTDDSYPASMARVQINVFGKEYDTVAAIESAVIIALNRKAPGTYGGHTLILSTYDGSVDLSEDSADSDGFFHIASDFLINYSNG